MHGLMMDAPLLITEIMRFAERNFADTEIVSVTLDQPRHRTTWREVFRRARKLANALQAAGVQPGDRIGTLAWNDYRHLELYYAVSCIGAVLHTVNPRLFPEQLEFIINHAEDKLLFVDATLLPVLASLQGKLPGVERTIVMTDAASMPPAVAGRLPDYESFIAGHSEAFDWPVLDERSASSLCYTSGTTGNPKGVLYSHRSTVLHAYGGCMVDSLGLSGRDCVLAVVPMFHANAWGLPYTAPMTGAKLVFPGPRMGDAPTLTQLMNEEGVTLAAAVPTVWTMLLNHLQQSGEKLQTLRRTVIGGSAVPLQMIRDFRDRHGVTVIQGWGMTETSPLGSVSTLRADQLQLPEEEQVQLRGKAGHGIFGISMKVVGDDGVEELPWDGVSAGELKVSGPWVCGAYFRLDHSPAHEEPGWFATGDVAVIHPNGFLQITDRAKDVIKSGGEWISSVDLENCACGHPDVLMAAAIGVRHPKWEERPVLLVVPRPGCEPRVESVLEHLAQHFAKWQLPDTIVFVEALPLTATGKINKRSLRDTYGQVLMEQTGTS